ncbi:HIT-like domain-containing protein [Crassisporium funariophilum]|nr:HIT-like domain-containing protein [Crassisporium funariophilum]
MPINVQAAIKDNGDNATSPNVLESCTFCHASNENGFKIAYEDDSFVAFEDRKPASTFHFLVIPKGHIESVRSLRKADVILVKDMENIGNVILGSLDVPLPMRRMGFHIPPFNSVSHLHLHVQGLPYLASSRAAKYPVRHGSGENSKGLTWFVEVKQAIQILERGKRVGVLPC